MGQRVCSHSGSEFGDLSSEEEEMIDAGCDPVVESVPTLPEYWNDDGFFGQDFVRASGMNRARFMNILTALHLCEFELDRQNEVKKARKEPYDPLFK